MKYLFMFLACLHFVAAAHPQANYKRLHKKAVVIDTHNDVLSSSVLEGKDIAKRLPSGHSDLPRWKEGGVDVQFFSVFTGPNARNKEGHFKDANQEIDSLEKIVQRNQDKMILAKSFPEVKKGMRRKKLVALIGVEGGHMIGEDLSRLEALYRRGMRYMTLTWNNSTSWASSAKDESSGKTVQKGLTEFGREVVRKMNELGIIVDLSHTGEQTFYDALAISSKPVMLSHSSVWSLCPVFRNVKDDQIRAVAKNGGVICINFYSGFIHPGYSKMLDYLEGEGKKIVQDSLRRVLVNEDAVEMAWKKYQETEMKKVRPSIAELVDHIDYIVKLAGDDYVGLGADYDGVESLPHGLDDVSGYPQITAELLRRGYSKKSIRKILGRNVLRVMKANFR